MEINRQANKTIATFEDAFPQYNGPMRLFGTLKKKQKGGLGKLLQKFETKQVDLNLSTGIFSYSDKNGNKIKSLPFREIESVVIRCVNEDNECPKEFPYSFSVKSKKREFFFSCKTKTERDQWLQCFDMLLEFRKILTFQATQNKISYQNTNQVNQSSSQLGRAQSTLAKEDGMQPIDNVQALQLDMQQIQGIKDAAQIQAMKQQKFQEQQYQTMKEEIERKRYYLSLNDEKLKKEKDKLERSHTQQRKSAAKKNQKAREDKRTHSRQKNGFQDDNNGEHEYDQETDSGAEDENEKYINRNKSSNEKEEEERKLQIRMKKQQEIRERKERQIQIQEEQIQKLNMSDQQDQTQEASKYKDKEDVKLRQQESQNAGPQKTPALEGFLKKTGTPKQILIKRGLSGSRDPTNESLASGSIINNIQNMNNLNIPLGKRSPQNMFQKQSPVISKSKINFNKQGPESINQTTISINQNLKEINKSQSNTINNAENNSINNQLGKYQKPANTSQISSNEKNSESRVELIPRNSTHLQNRQTPKSIRYSKSSNRKQNIMEIEGDPDDLEEELPFQMGGENIITGQNQLQQFNGQLLDKQTANNLNLTSNNTAVDEFFKQYEKDNKMRQSQQLMFSTPQIQKKLKEQEIQNGIQHILEVKNQVTQDFNEIIQKQRDQNFLERIEKKRQVNGSTNQGGGPLIITKDKINLVEEAQREQVQIQKLEKQKQSGWLINAEKNQSNGQYNFNGGYIGTPKNNSNLNQNINNLVLDQKHLIDQQNEDDDPDDFDKPIIDYKSKTLNFNLNNLSNNGKKKLEQFDYNWDDDEDQEAETTHIGSSEKKKQQSKNQDNKNKKPVNLVKDFRSSRQVVISSKDNFNDQNKKISNNSNNVNPLGKQDDSFEEVWD
ncbi:UNKNOWN [Stylonychia lemnae]|uniref:PH domain-containing protein n=1 Tax=Stylonychia lemnae TaxID=5949 RepID=A0A078B0Q7_STYLE|nr:UNKNOWN [Stylonychia lemnae]|eukprot:CDW88245.1 UNKNOWN [Stylonychia lemnae]